MCVRKLLHDHDLGGGSHYVLPVQLIASLAGAAASGGISTTSI